MRTLFLVVLLIGLAAAALTFAMTTALGADEATDTVWLEPGDNFIGWVAEPIAVDDIFEAIPAASLIYTWNADARSYRHAVRDVDGTLETIHPGMAVRIRIDGRRSVKWDRPLTPAKGMVTLYSGENWVAWNGRDKWPLDEVARGIGTSLTSIEVRGIAYQPNSDVSDTVGPLIGDIAIRRGDALRVTVNRDLRWLQPTGMMPKIVYAGDPPQSLKDEITADIRRVVDFFAGEFAVETDFSETTVLLYHSIDAAVEYLESGAEPQWRNPPGWLRGILTHGGQASSWPWGFYMSTCAWQTPNPQPCRHKAVETLTHEWFHVLQEQLAAREPWHLSPTWIFEGSAMWVEWLLPRDWRAIPYERDHKWRVDQAARTSVRLQSLEKRNGDWSYRIGPLAVERLAELRSEDALLEFYRRLHPQISGTERRWMKNPVWNESFEAAFGLTAAEYYQEFAAWRETLPKPARRYDYYQDDTKLSGSLRNSDGSPATGFRLYAAPLRGEFVADDSQRVAAVDEGGVFSIDVAPQSMQRVWFTRDGCTLWLTNDGLTMARPMQDQYRDLDTRNVPMLDLTLPEDACENELRISILRLRGDDRRVEVTLNSEDGRTWTSARLDRFGFYTVFAPEPSRHYVRVTAGGCNMWYAERGLVASKQNGALVELLQQPVSIQARIPDDLCVRTISGRMVTENGTPVQEIEMFASGDGPYSFTNSAASGEFNITVPVSGSYGLSFWIDDVGCRIHYASQGATSNRQQATPITVADSDVTGIEFVVPDDPASLCE